tara:strand:+ start:589 stop:1257 length:669 start_codon:yes stop_codon:yes gene_type:complete
MTSLEMKTLLGLRLEDAGQVNFTEAVKLSALNVAQRTACTFLHENYLTELEYRDIVLVDSTSINAGLITLTGDGIFGTNFGKSSKKVIRNSIHMVQTKVGTTYRYCIKIPFSDVKKLENEYLGAEENNPVFWVFGNNLHIRPMTGMSQAVLYYLRMPVEITTSVACELNASLHDMIVDLAEAECWRIDNNVNRSEVARKSAMDSLTMLNTRYETEKPTGVNG